METAHARIIEQGFQFAKGKPHLKKDINPSDDQPTKKWQKLSQDMRDQRLKDIEDDCQDITDQIQKRIVACEHSRDYKKCDELKEEIIALKQQRHQLQAETTNLKNVTLSQNGTRKRSMEV